MDDTTHIRVNESLAIPRAELTFRASRSGGPGGQHVNTSATRVELLWNVRESQSIGEDQRARLVEKLATRIDDKGEIRLVGSTGRSQHQNREEVVERFARLIERSLRIPKPRKKTRIPKSSKEARLREKKHRSDRKSSRGKVQPDE